MFFLLLTACAAPESSGHAPPPERSYVARTARICAVVAPDSPSKPGRLVFLHRGAEGVDAQAELTWDDPSTDLRCAPVRLYVEDGRDGSVVIFDYVPVQPDVAIAELRAYRERDAWTPEDPHAVAAYDHGPFQDYLFTVNLVAAPGPGDASTILLP